jgi:RHH-type rel operon transcriptional repressor/antitoxin RelB
MLGVRLPETLDRRLGLLAQKTHRPKSFYVKEALEAYLDANEEVFAAVADYEEQVRNGTLVTYSLEEIKSVMTSIETWQLETSRQADKDLGQLDKPIKQRILNYLKIGFCQTETLDNLARS